MKKLLLLLCMSAGIFVSCENNDETNDAPIGLVAGVNSVTEIPVIGNADAMFKVDFYVNNGCGKFSAFDETSEGNTRTIKVLSKYEGEICTMDLPLLETVYTFKATTAGSYTLKFVKDDGTFFTENVVVE